MEFLRPATWEEALAVKAQHPSAVPIAGGTDVMVELNFDRHRPDALLDLNRIHELHTWRIEDDDTVRLGASVPYSKIIDALHDRLPGLSLGARTVGSPQIRNRGSVGGNLGGASPAGDAHPPLLASGATVEAASVRGTRLIPIDDFYLGVKRNALEPDELIRAIHIPSATGPQQFAKIGTRNAMVIAVCSFAVALHPRTRNVRTGIGSAAPTPRRASAAEAFIRAELHDTGLWTSGGELPAATAERFGELVAQAAAPIDDVRGSAAYRRHALAVMARRTLLWTWNDHRATGRAAA
ncbi:FAD binding domain-containing protein [Embleya sp. NPDC008237]|uniref:FAD binding domain-containing protein n=1 Tax=Embleya sp. NPDC008237 TaxID=3363978 RepID=UPI0036E0713B